MKKVASVKDILGNDIYHGDICAFAVKNGGHSTYGMDIGIFTHETRCKLSFKVPCWWCNDDDTFYTSAVRKTNRVIVIAEPWFHVSEEYLSRALYLKELLYEKGILIEE